jgi:LysR family nitrogen assimilation transcriptional regulator
VELRQLRSFVHIAELGSISLASERVCIVQPALSRQIQALEEELSVRLFIRHGRGVVLTPEGELLLARAISIIREVEQAKEELADHSSCLSGELSFGMPPTVAEVLSGPLIEQFANRYPGVRLRVVSGYSGHVLDWLQKGALDFGVLYETNRLPTIRSTQLIAESLFLIQRSQPDADVARVPFCEALSKRLILPSAQHGLRNLIEGIASRFGLAVRPVVEVDSLPVQIDLVRRGLGATILPFVSVFREVAAGELSATPIVDPGITRSLVLARAIDRAAKKGTQLFAETIVAEIANLARAGRWPGLVPEAVEVQTHSRSAYPKSKQGLSSPERGQLSTSIL